MSHYTLPGVMHYLQTEFTKNERDRISWELEKAEMKQRIQQLESENKKLKHRLSSQQDPFVSIKQSVHENVNEIIHLLKQKDFSTDTHLLLSDNLEPPQLENLNLHDTAEEAAVSIKFTNLNTLVVLYRNSIKYGPSTCDPNRLEHRIDLKDVKEIIDVFMFDTTTLLTLSRNGLLQAWSLNSLIDSLKVPSWPTDTSYVDFTNKKLLVGNKQGVSIYQISLDDGKLSVEQKTQDPISPKSKSVGKAIFGMTEDSLIALVKAQNSNELVMYNFQGEILQQVSLPGKLQPHITTLVLDKRASHLVIQLDQTIILYSFDQKTITLKHDLDRPIAEFIYTPLAVLVVYKDYKAEVRQLENIGNTVKSMHLQEASIFKNNRLVLDATALLQNDASKLRMVTSTASNQLESKDILIK